MKVGGCKIGGGWGLNPEAMARELAAAADSGVLRSLCLRVRLLRIVFSDLSGRFVICGGLVATGLLRPGGADTVVGGRFLL